ncbi:hypothetical protein N1851_023199 [Merluccius polli]|uniref:Uncharacterized protein n=1 Tax=Merluccius polli TaxID=89951 RepID=A0AA47MGM2_MERPO|nr:hypothetical protein N1851_023199 [Merluccius polli]
MAPLSEASKQILLLELTVTWEGCIEEANERKRAKHAKLVEQCRSNGRRVRCEPIEVGSITGTSKRRASKTVTEAAEDASRWLRIRRVMGEILLPGHKLGLNQSQLGRLGKTRNT